MKELTNIKHKNKDRQYCSETLQREIWGADTVGNCFYRMTCWKCGFVEVITDGTFQKWQYCDEVVI